MIFPAFMRRRFPSRGRSRMGFRSANGSHELFKPSEPISDNPEIYQNLSVRDQALVTQGQIRHGMPRSAVWLAWGSPDQKVVGNMAGTPTETWIYIYYATYPYYPLLRPWALGALGSLGCNDSGPGYSLGYTSVGVAGGRAGVAVAGEACITTGTGRSCFLAAHSTILSIGGQRPPSIPYPGKVVTFVGSRVMSFQYLTGYVEGGKKFCRVPPDKSVLPRT